MTLFPMDGVLLEVRNRKEICRVWSPIDTTSHVRTLSMLFFLDLTDMSFITIIPGFFFTTCLCIFTSDRIHSLMPVYHRVMLLWF
jgi:hypothetical protein